MMNIKYMRILLMFDLPIETKLQQKEYTKFHKSLISHGFVMIQYSIYVKIVNTESKVLRVIDKIRVDLPSKGNIRILVVTDKQYQDMIFLVGDKNLNEQINTNERYIKC